MYLPGMDDGCLEVFLDELSKRYPDHHLLVVLDGAPSHRSKQIVHPENISFLGLPPHSPELDPAEKWFQEFRRSLSNRTFESVALIQEADEGTAPVLGDSFPPQTAYRLLMVGKGGGGVSMTSINRNGMRSLSPGSTARSARPAREDFFNKLGGF